jgi:hypothetical protein
MNDRTRLYWERMRRHGILFYLMLWAFGVGSLLWVLEIGWDWMVDHTQTGKLFACLFGVVCVLFALVVGAANWHVNEKRYRLSNAL